MFAILTLLAATQILIEMLPISSTGHVFLVEYLMLKLGYISSYVALPEWFEYCLNIPALIVLAVFFGRSFFPRVTRTLRITFFWMKGCPLRFSQRQWLHLAWTLILYVISADLITAGPYFLYKWYGPEVSTCTQHLLGFIITGLALYSLRFAPSSVTNAHSLNFCRALMLGIVQGMAKVFSYSRFGSTFVAGSWLGLSPRRAIEVSFLIYAPLLLASSVKGICTIPRAGEMVTFCTQPMFLATVCGTTLLSYFILSFVYRAVLKRTLWKLGLYMIIPALLMLLLQFNH